MSQQSSKFILVRGSQDSKMPTLVNINGKIVPIPHPSTIAAFIDSLSNPDHPTRCSVFYAGVEKVFTSHSECAEELRRMNPDIFATAIRFLSHFRSDTNVATIAQPVCKCPKDSNWWVHDVAQRRPSTASEASEQLFESICSIAHRGLMDKKEVGFTSPWPTIEKLVKSSDKSLKATGRAIWPMKYADVFGGNPLILAYMLWTIFNHFPDAYNPLFLLYSLTRMSSSTMMPALARVPSWARQLVDHANRTLDANHRLRRYLGKFDLLTEFMNEVRLVLSQGGDMSVFSAWHLPEDRISEDAVLFASRALCMDIFKDSYDEQAERLAIIGSFFYESCNSPNAIFGLDLDEEWPPLSPRIRTELYNPFEQYQADPSLLIKDACEKMHNLTVFGGCAAPNCSVSSATLDRKLQSCSACHVVRYCSQECQHAAWKHPEISHKPMCRLFSTVNKKLGVDWKKFKTTESDQEAILNRSIERLTAKEAEDIIDSELRIVTWRMLARSEPTGEVSRKIFRLFMEGTHKVQKIQREKVTKT
ncbi:hypothetical protein CYLTODRAFT_426163 [Cylindrobasidium torrendii FP15055 ss-10]|uniref:MYND-type domain-containing protein n=1 Tax=Cylindrobasidium torrendii FP15055 ss-10 TaxID=1314674 RepID=A0A0D7AYD3_9AGAR|nr:hypothetical protein CYLTODRAFT_426163 [Cylindrobasidium torrendii FP15055 ss-10]